MKKGLRAQPFVKVGYCRVVWICVDLCVYESLAKCDDVMMHLITSLFEAEGPCGASLDVV
jgi:hypothetical protein